MTDLTQPTNNLTTSQRAAVQPRALPAVMATARLELTLSTRALSFWLVQLAILASTLLVLMPDGFTGTYLRFASQQLREFTAFALLLLPLLALPGLQRLQGPRGDVVLTTTHDNFTHTLGTILGIFSWLIPATLLHLLARWLMGELLNGQANWTLLTHAPLLTLASLTLGLGVLSCLTLIWKRILPVLLVWLGLWVLILQGAGGLLGGFVGPYMPLFNPWNVFYEGVLLSPAVGLGLSQPLISKHTIWLAALGITLLAAWITLAPMTDSRRSNRHRYLPAAALALTLGLTVLSQFSFQQQVITEQPAMTPREVELDAWQVLASDLEVTINPTATNPIAGTTHMTLQVTGETMPETLILRLRSGMHLRAESGEQPLDVTRDGDSILIQIDTLELAPDARLEVQLHFEGSPEWPYSDHRFQTGGAFPVVDSNQSITSALINEAGYLLRDGDWRPWPWTTHPQTAMDRDNITIRTNENVTTYDGNAPQLLAVIPPSRTAEQARIHSGTDPSAGLQNALLNVAAGAERLWAVLNEAAAPQVIALPYLPDAYANKDAIVIPEAYDLSHDLQVDAAYQRNLPPELAARSGFILAARAWLNGNARHPRAYAEATMTRSSIQTASTFGPGAGDAYRLLQVSAMGPLGSRWSELWHGTDPSNYAVNPFALWLGIELAEPSVRQADLTLLRQLTGNAQDHLQLRQRGLPWNLTRQLPSVAITVALADWADTIGQDQAIRLFAEAYTTTESQDHQAILTTLGIMSGATLNPIHAGGNQ